MKIIVAGGDGFCGWATSLRLASAGAEVLILDNLSRRKIDEELSTNSLTEIFSIQERVLAAKKLFPTFNYEIVDLAKNYDALSSIILSFKPDAFVHFAEQRSAPYSMISNIERRYTVDNNIIGTNNILSALVENASNCHLVHLGTMGVYGYSDRFGEIQDGFLEIVHDNNKEKILYPSDPGSIYHMTKVLDQHLFYYYNKNWNLKITDLHQGIVWGTQTNETLKDDVLINRFDYDGIYGTVLNRFIVQASNGLPLTVYGSGGQERAFIHINDTAECIKLALSNKSISTKGVKIFNQIAETFSVKELAELVSNTYGVPINYIENPRKELIENKLKVSNEGLRDLGYKPVLLSKDLVKDVKYLAERFSKNFLNEKILNSPKW